MLPRSDSTSDQRRVPAVRRAGKVRRRAKSAAIALIFIAPAFISIILFAYYPMVQGIIYAFQRVTLVQSPQWLGLDNFRTVIGNQYFLIAWRNTFYYAVIIVFFANIVPLLFATLIHEVRGARWLFQLAVYLPVMTPPLVVALLWQWVYNPRVGLANTILGLVGIGPLSYLSSESQALPAIAVIAIWSSWGFACLVYLATLSGISPELYDAAEIDGASVARRFRHITLPQVQTQLGVLTLLGVLSVLQLFALPFALTGGGPVGATTTVTLLVYQYAFGDGDLGSASALSLMLMAVLIVMSILYAWVMKRVNR